jgi:hypothetical protein
MHPTPSTKIQTHTFVSLTPDDILTLKLLRDEYRTWFWKRDIKRRDVDTERTLETLERILKQVG